MLQTLHLVCLTTDKLGTFDHALLVLKPTLARQLLEYRPVYRYVHDHDSTLFCLEFFDSTVQYGSLFEHLEIDEEITDGKWLSCSGDPKLSAYPVEAATLKITGTGVLWSASPKNGEGYFETPEITWEQLEDIVFHYKDPFEPAQTGAAANG